MSNRKYVKTPTILQMEATECGAASLAMILAYFGCNIPLEQLRIDSGVSRNGSNAKNLYYAAEKYHLNVKGYSKSVEGLLGLPVPCILHWNFNHFVVFEGVKGKFAYINDPAHGRRKITMDELESSFTGICLTFEPGDDFVKIGREKSEINVAKSRLMSEKSAMLAIFLMGLLLVVPGVVFPIFSSVFMDEILIKGMTDWMLPLLSGMILTILFNIVFKLIRSNILLKLQDKMSLISAYKFLSQMMSLPIPFFEQRYAGDLSERVKNNNKVNEFLTGNLGQAVLDMFVACFYLILMFFYSPIMAIVVILCTAFSVIYGMISSKTLEPISKKSQQGMSKLIGVLYSGLSIRDTLKSSGAETEYVSRVIGYDANVTVGSQEIGRVQQILNSIPDAIIQFANVIILTLGGINVIHGEMTPGMLLAFVQLMSGFTTPVVSITKLFQQIQTLKADIGRIEDIEKYPSDSKTLTDKPSKSIDEKLSGQVELSGISFGYSELEPAIIQDFDFVLEPGSSVALVGSSGCGKTTIGKLVSGLHSPWTGSVRFDGIDIADIDRDVFTDSVSTVSQDISIFSGSIKENLTLWNPLVMEPDIIEAAKDACIHDYITMQPGAYDFELSEGGSNLSGGQRQRIEIARALATNPSILIMDEATSALDPIVEKQIMDNIKRRGCSVIIVAHRLSTIRDCDEIIVMEKGQIVERGTHEKLLSKRGRYAKLIKNA